MTSLENVIRQRVDEQLARQKSWLNRIVASSRSSILGIFVSGLPFAGQDELISVASSQTENRYWYIPELSMLDGAKIDYNFLLGSMEFEQKIWLLFGQPETLSRRFKVKEIRFPVPIVGVVNVVNPTHQITSKAFARHIELSLLDDIPFAVLVNQSQHNDGFDLSAFSQQYGLNKACPVEVVDITQKYQVVSAMGRILQYFERHG